MNINDRIALRDKKSNKVFADAHITKIDGNLATTDFAMGSKRIVFDLNTNEIIAPEVFSFATVSPADENTDAEIEAANFDFHVGEIARKSKEIAHDSENVARLLKEGHMTFERDRALIRESLLRRAKELAEVAEAL